MAAKNAFDRETKRLEKMFLEEQIDQEMLRQQEEKTRRLLHESKNIKIISTRTDTINLQKFCILVFTSKSNKMKSNNVYQSV